MSSTQARQLRQLMKKTTAGLRGQQRGPDHGPDHEDGRRRRVPHKRSHCIDDPKALVFKRIGDGSVAHGIVYTEALLQTADELRQQHWADHPLKRQRADRARSAELEAEMAELLQPNAAAPPGRLARIREELARLTKRMLAAERRLRRIDVTVLASLLRFVDYATGALFPSIDTIAEDAGCHRNSVLGALRRLRRHGLIDWVRRTVRTGNPGQGPQLEQTSNGYFFDHRAAMDRRTWARYLDILTRKLRRLGKVPADIVGAAASALSAVERIADPALRDSLTRLQRGVDRAST